MANSEHLKILKQGVKAWNQWISKHPDIIPDFTSANLAGATLINANLKSGIFHSANLKNAKLNKADLCEAQLHFADLSYADLSDVNLRGARLFFAHLTHTNLNNADLNHAMIGFTVFGGNSLSGAKGLDTIEHVDPSTIGLDTIYLCESDIPESFLVGTGLPDHYIGYVRSLMGKAGGFYSCFISYSSKDEEFTRHLYSRMRAEKLRVWFAPVDIQGGKKVYEQLENAIQLYDRLLLVLSENSMQSEWVMTEIRNARKAEIEEKKRKLFPIRLVDFETIKKWKCFDSENGKDLAVELRDYYMPDFSNWKDYTSFEVAFKKLLRDLKAEY